MQLTQHISRAVISVSVLTSGRLSLALALVGVRMAAKARWNSIVPDVVALCQHNRQLM